MVTKPKRVKPTDVYVGQRLKARRLEQKLSQESVADLVGLTFQQIQKYEKGTNRIGSSRLQQLGDVLKVPVSYFFEGLPGQNGNRGSSEQAQRFTMFMAEMQGAKFMQALEQMPEELRPMYLRIGRVLAGIKNGY